MSLSALGGLAAASFVLSLSACALVKHVARRLRLVDVPNQRSLHQVPVPRLGGVAIVASVYLLLGATALAGSAALLQKHDLVVVLAGALGIAVLGLVDDLRPLPPIVRLLVQMAAATVVVVLLPINDLALTASLRMHAGHGLILALAVLFVAGTTNIYNFMDGMDGLAATQAMGAALALAAAAGLAGHLDLVLVALVFGAAAGGFFVHNAPPASLFLGDAGSTFFGFVFSSLTLLAASRPQPVPVSVVPLALAPFLLDGSFTIARRLLRGERVWHAHRSHLYQRAVATSLTHKQVLVVYAAWCAVAAAAAVVAARGSGPVASSATFAAALPLALVWRWVVGRERTTAPAGSD